MDEYIRDCTEKKIVSRLSDPDNSETRSVLNVDITKPFQDVLKLSHEAVTWQKQKRTEATSGSVKIIEDTLNALYEDVKQNIDSPEASFNDIISLATSYCNMGIAYKDFTSKKKLVVARSHLKKCFELLSGKELDPRAILVLIRAVVQLDHVFRQLNEGEKSCFFSHKAIGFYLEYTSQGRNFPAPIVSLFSAKLDIEKKMQSNTLLSLMTLHSELLHHIKDCDSYNWDLETLVKPIHNFFMNQWIEASKNPLKEVYDWACATLDFSRYFLNHLRFSDARNYLAAVQLLIDNQYEGRISNLSAEKFFYVVARFATGWTIYGNNLLFSSKNNLYSKYVKVRRARKSKSKSSVMLPTKSLIFTDLEEDVKHIVSEIPVTVSNIYDANLIGTNNAKCFDMLTKTFLKEYLLENPSFFKQTIGIIETSKYLPDFEVDRVKRMTLHEERIKFLTDVKNYSSNFKDENFKNKVSARCNFELLLASTKLLDAKLEDAEINEKNFEDIREEMVNIATSGLKYCEEYLQQSDVLKPCETRD